MSEHSTSRSLTRSEQRRILAIDGNDRCADCFEINPQWADISHGILVCLKCSGKHRGLGVAIAVVRSLLLDDWTLKQQQRMWAGGNKKWTQYYSSNTVSPVSSCSTPELIPQIYQSDLAASYRDQLTQRHELLYVQANSESGKPTQLPALLLGKPPAQDETALQLMIKCTLCAASFTEFEIDSHSRICHSNQKSGIDAPDEGQRTASPAEDRYVTFVVPLALDDGRLGITVGKTSAGAAVITKVLPGGAAEKHSIPAGCRIIGVNSMMVRDYETIIASLRDSAKPIQLHLEVRKSRLGDHSFVLAPSSGASTPVDSPRAEFNIEISPPST